MVVKRDYATKLGEVLVANWLAKEGWSPHRTSATANPGIPDYECSEHKWVELKNVAYGHIDISICQLKYWRKLVSQGDKVFLVLYDSKKEIVGTPPMDISSATLSDIAELVNAVIEEGEANIE